HALRDRRGLAEHALRLRVVAEAVVGVAEVDPQGARAAGVARGVERREDGVEARQVAREIAGEDGLVGARPLDGDRRRRRRRGGLERGEERIGEVVAADAEAISAALGPPAAMTGAR